MSSVRRAFVLVGLPVLFVLCALIWWLSRSDATSPPMAAAAPDRVLVHTARVLIRNVPIRVQGIGVIRAWSTVTVRSRIDGQLESVGFHEGDVVRRGQLLAKLDDRVQTAQLALARAQQARDQAQLDNARRDLKRYADLARQSAINRQTLDTQQAQVATLEATVQADQAQVRYAQVQLDYTRIVSPLTGRTGVLQVDPGNVVHAADTVGLVVVNQMDPVAVTFTVPDTAFSLVQAAAEEPHVAGASPHGGQSVKPLPVEVYAQGQSKLLGRGTLELIDNQIDGSSGTLQLKARLANPSQTLWPGQTVDARLILGDHASALVVPDSAVQRGAQGLFVYVVRAGDAVQVQQVSVLVSQDGVSVISRGLKADERVVVDGQYKLRPGSKVAEAPADTSKPEAGS